jgi:hypothetical protein
MKTKFLNWMLVNRSLEVDFMINGVRGERRRKVIFLNFLLCFFIEKEVMEIKFYNNNIYETSKGEKWVWEKKGKDIYLTSEFCNKKLQIDSVVYSKNTGKGVKFFFKGNSGYSPYVYLVNDTLNDTLTIINIARYETEKFLFNNRYNYFVVNEGAKYLNIKSDLIKFKNVDSITVYLNINLPLHYNFYNNRKFKLINNYIFDNLDHQNKYKIIGKIP